MSKSKRRILMIGVARIGDTLLLTPAMRAAAALSPDVELTVLAHPARREVLESLPFIHHLGSINKQRARCLGWLPGRPYDQAFVWGKDVELVRYALRVAREVYAFEEEEFAGLRAKRLKRIKRPHGGHAVRERLALIEGAGIVAQDFRLAYVVRQEERSAAESRLRSAQLEGHPLIGLQAFSFPTKAHRDWPIGHFAELIERVSRDYPEANFVVLGDAQAAIRAISLAERFPKLRILAGQTSLRESAALMSCLDLYVGVDTGPTHIAGALGIPMVAMYHYRYPGKNLAPLQNPLCSIIEHPATGIADTSDVSGMESIPVHAVADLALALLAAGR